MKRISRKVEKVNKKEFVSEIKIDNNFQKRYKKMPLHTSLTFFKIKKRTLLFK